jgi:hypothetical protein
MTYTDMGGELGVDTAVRIANISQPIRLSKLCLSVGGERRNRHG